MTFQFKQFKQTIKNSSKPIYIAGHINPDQDSICSSLALARFLEKLGKATHVLIEDYDRNVLTPHDDINHTERLVVNDIIEQDYIFIALDLNETYRLGRYEQHFKNSNLTINIDHHQGNKTNANLVISQTDKSSTCEIIYNLIMSYDSIYLDQDIANYLYTGIMTDTSCFSRRISPTTMPIAQKLINMGVNYEKKIKSTFSHRTLYELKALASLIENIKYDECLHYLIIDKSLEQYSSLTHNQITKTIAEELRKIEDMDIFLIFIVDKNSITAKCMSNITKNANLIAEYFGGGGHKGEAGFTVNNMSVEEIIQKTKNYLNNN